MNEHHGVMPGEYARFVELIGMEGTLRLLELYGGDAVALPDCKALKRVRRDNEILSLHRQGLDRTEIGRRLGISRHAVHGVVQRGWAFDAEDYEAFMSAPFCELAQQIGLDAAETLCGALGGKTLHFPEPEGLRILEEQDGEQFGGAKA